MGWYLMTSWGTQPLRCWVWPSGNTRINRNDRIDKMEWILNLFPYEIGICDVTRYSATQVLSMAFRKHKNKQECQNYQPILVIRLCQHSCQIALFNYLFNAVIFGYNKLVVFICQYLLCNLLNTVLLNNWDILSNYNKY